MKNTKISVVTVTLNSENTIQDTIESILNQTYTPFEYIIIDGLSVDNTLDIAYSYEASFKEKGIRYTIICEKDKGIYDAMNKGIKCASGDLIGLLNADDWYEQNALDKILTKFVSNDKQDGVYYGAIRIWKDNLEYKIRQNHHNFLHEHVIQHPTCFISRTTYKEFGLYDHTLRVAADYQLLNRFKNAGVNFYNTDELITNFRLGGMSTKAAITGAREYNDLKFSFGYISKRKHNLIKLRLRLISIVKLFI